MRNYFLSHSKFADYIRKEFKLPHALTWLGWDEYHTKFKTIYPIRNWIVNVLFHHIENIIYWLPEKYNKINYYIRNVIGNTHRLSTTFKLGSWHDLDIKITDGIFQSFVDFIEIEKAWMHKISYSNIYPSPWYKKFKRFREPLLGLAYLQWEMSLIKDDDWIIKDDPEHGKPTPQAESAKIQYEIYNFIKNVRPNRIDPYDDYDLMKEKYPNYSQMIDEMEQKHFEEDTKYLQKIIEIRSHLWT